MSSGIHQVAAAPEEQGEPRKEGRERSSTGQRPTRIINVAPARVVIATAPMLIQ